MSGQQADPLGVDIRDPRVDVAGEVYSPDASQRAKGRRSSGNGRCTLRSTRASRWATARRTSSRHWRDARSPRGRHAPMLAVGDAHVRPTWRAIRGRHRRHVRPHRVEHGVDMGSLRGHIALNVRRRWPAVTPMFDAPGARCEVTLAVPDASDRATSRATRGRDDRHARAPRPAEPVKSRLMGGDDRVQGRRCAVENAVDAG